MKQQQITRKGDGDKTSQGIEAEIGEILNVPESQDAIEDVTAALNEAEKAVKSASKEEREKSKKELADMQMQEASLITDPDVQFCCGQCGNRVCFGWADDYCAWIPEECYAEGRYSVGDFESGRIRFMSRGEVEAFKRKSKKGAEDKWLKDRRNH